MEAPVNGDVFPLKAAMDKALTRQVTHAICNLSRAPQQLSWKPRVSARYVHENNNYINTVL